MKNHSTSTLTTKQRWATKRLHDLGSAALIAIAQGGESGVRAYAEEVQEPLSFVKELSRFAEAFPMNLVRSIDARAAATGATVSYPMYAQLLGVSDRAKREALLEAVIDEQLTSFQLRQRIRAESALAMTSVTGRGTVNSPSGSKRLHPGGMRLHLPTTMIAAPAPPMGAVAGPSVNTGGGEDIEACCRQILTLLAGDAAATIECYHQVGLIVRDVMNTARHGGRGVKELGTRLNMAPVTLYKYAALARTFSAKEISDAGARALLKGFVLAPSIVLEISATQGHDQFAALNHVIDANLTVHQFRREQRLKKSPGAASTKQTSRIEAVTAKINCFNTDLERLLDDAAEKDIHKIRSRQDLAYLQSAVASMAQTINETLARLGAKLEEALARDERQEVP